MSLLHHMLLDIILTSSFHVTLAIHAFLFIQAYCIWYIEMPEIFIHELLHVDD
jgi:hypothetical protein